MNTIKNFFLKIITWIKSFFFKPLEKELFHNEVIGTAVFESRNYLFIRKEEGIFLVSDTEHRHYSQKIHFSKTLEPYLSTMRDLDAITLEKGKHALVATISLQKEDQIVYLTSKDTHHFVLQEKFKKQGGSAHKLVRNNRNQIFVFASINGEISYKEIKNKEKTEYVSAHVGPRDNSFDHGPLHVVGVQSIDDGIFVIYEVSYSFEGYQTHHFGAVLLAHDNPSHLHWRANEDEVPFWENFISRKNSDVHLRSLGSCFKDGEIKILFLDETHKDIYYVELHQPYHRRQINPQKAYLKKYINNPIMRPNEANAWENYAVFNPATIELNGLTHMLYRAEGSAGLSVIGYGKSYNGVTFNRLADPVYVPRMHFEGVGAPKTVLRRGNFKSGYNHYPVDQSFEWHGVEDPRITELDGRLYLIYAAYNGYQMARPAITSIDKQDFLNGNWKWETPQPMTDVAIHHGDGNKNVVLFPEKVNGKYLLFHRIWPHIRIDYVDDLEFGPNKKYLKELKQIPARGDSWDSHKIAVASAPIRIDEGWLLIYQGAGSQDRQYKVGAMILDYNDPSKVLYRSNYPILVPGEWYENEHKFGVAYPCGAVIKEGMLNVYYGGSDKYVCVASAPLGEFIQKLKQDPYRASKLQKAKNIKELCI